MKIDRLSKIIKAVETDEWGHESWIIIGVEQHKMFWYAVLGDCSFWHFTPDENISVRVRCGSLNPIDMRGKGIVVADGLYFTAKTLDKLLEKIEYYIKKRRERMKMSSNNREE